MKRTLITVWGTVLICLSFMISLNAHAEHADEAISEAMLATFNKLIVVFEPKDADFAAQQKAVAEVIDFDVITRGILKDHLKSLSDSQKQAFRSEFERSLTKLLGTALKDTEDYDVAIERIQKSSRNPNRARVLGVLTSPKNERFELLTTIAYQDDHWMVRNMIVNGINLGLTYRNQFNELVERNSGDFDATIAAWAEAVNRTAV